MLCHHNHTREILTRIACIANAFTIRHFKRRNVGKARLYCDIAVMFQCQMQRVPYEPT